MANRQVYPSSLFPLRGDVSAESGATSVLVTGIQGIPVISPPTEPASLDTFFYDSYTNEWFYASPWDIPVGRVLEFEGYGYDPVGISWLASDTIAVGDGTQGDVSGAAAMTALILFGSPGYDYAYEQCYTTIYSGATQNWNLVLPPTAGSAGQVLTTNGSGVTSWITVSGGGTPGGSTGDIQYNNAGSFAGSAATVTAAGSLIIPEGQILAWEGGYYSTAALSAIATDTLGVGNGTAGDVSGGMGMTALILFGSSAYGSAYDLYHTTVYSGATENWNLILPETPGTSGQLLTTNGKGFTYWSSAVASSVMTTLGDTLYGGASGAATRLPGNTSSTREFLVSAGSSGSATSPFWSALVGADLPSQYVSGQSGFFGGLAGSGLIIGSIGNTTGFAANAAACWLFYIAAPITVSKATIYVSTGASATAASIGIFNTAGTKLVDSGTFSTTTSTTTMTNTFTAVTLQPVGIGMCLLQAVLRTGSYIWVTLEFQTCLTRIAPV